MSEESKEYETLEAELTDAERMAVVALQKACSVLGFLGEGTLYGKVQSAKGMVLQGVSTLLGNFESEADIDAWFEYSKRLARAAWASGGVDEKRAEAHKRETELQKRLEANGSGKKVNIIYDAGDGE